jgi:hypothetical protein
VRIEMDRGNSVTTLAVDIEIPNGQRLSVVPPVGHKVTDSRLSSARSQWSNGLV